MALDASAAGGDFRRWWFYPSRASSLLQVMISVAGGAPFASKLAPTGDDLCGWWRALREQARSYRWPVPMVDDGDWGWRHCPLHYPRWRDRVCCRSELRSRMGGHAAFKDPPRGMRPRPWPLRVQVAISAVGGAPFASKLAPTGGRRLWWMMVTGDDVITLFTINYGEVVSAVGASSALEWGVMPPSKTPPRHETKAVADSCAGDDVFG